MVYSPMCLKKNSIFKLIWFSIDSTEHANLQFPNEIHESFENNLYVMCFYRFIKSL